MSLFITYDGNDLSSYIDVILNVEKKLTPKSISREIYIPSKEGRYFFDRNFGKREIEMDVLLVGTSQSDLINKIHNLNKKLYKDEPKQLIFSDENDKHFNALFVGSTNSINRRVWHATMNLKFECFDPFAYTTTSTSGNQDCTADPTSISISNDGNYYTNPIWVITFNQTQTHIALYNNSTAKRIDISRSFVTTDKLKIDTKNRIIYYDNGSGYVEDWEGIGQGDSNRAEWVRLKKGNNNCGISTTDATLNVNVAWEFNKTWL